MQQIVDAARRCVVELSVDSAKTAGNRSSELQTWAALRRLQLPFQTGVTSSPTRFLERTRMNDLSPMNITVNDALCQTKSASIAHFVLMVAAAYLDEAICSRLMADFEAHQQSGNGTLAHSVIRALPTPTFARLRPDDHRLSHGICGTSL